MFSLSDICIWTGGLLKNRVDGNVKILSVSTDTRSILPEALFVALRGEHFDGHLFLKEAAEKGAVACLIEDEDIWRSKSAGVSNAAIAPIPIIVVPDTLKALQAIAKSYRQKMSIPVVAITGSNGKTTTKNFIAAILQKKFKTAYTKGNFNNHIGLPLSILSMQTTDEIGVFEVGTNHPGEIKMLAELCQPAVAVITNIGVAHIEYFGSKDAIAKEKGELGAALPNAENGGVLILPKHEAYVKILASMTDAKVVEVSEDDKDFAHISKEIMHVREDMRAEHLLKDALLAAAVGKQFNVPDTDIIDALLNAKFEDGRFSLKTIDIKHPDLDSQSQKIDIIDDTYNANPDSVCAAIDAMAKLYPERNKILALGKLMEQGDFLNEGYARIIERANSVKISPGSIIFVGIDEQVQNILNTNISHVRDQAECAALIKKIIKNNTSKNVSIVLLKGSKSAEMKKVLDFF